MSDARISLRSLRLPIGGCSPRALPQGRSHIPRPGLRTCPRNDGPRSSRSTRSWPDRAARPLRCTSAISASSASCPPQHSQGTPSSPRTQSSRVGSTPSQPDRTTRSVNGRATSASMRSSRSPTRCCLRLRCRRGRAARRATSSSRCCTCASKTTSETSTSSRPVTAAASCTRSSRSSAASTSIATSPAPIRCSSRSTSSPGRRRHARSSSRSPARSSTTSNGGAARPTRSCGTSRRSGSSAMSSARSTPTRPMSSSWPSSIHSAAMSGRSPSSCRAGRRLRFRGTIDRIDRLHDRLRVIDYKTGTTESEASVRAGIASGTLLQLPIYGLAAQAEFDPAAPVAAGYWYVSSKGGWKDVIIPIDDAVQERFLHSLDTISTGIGSGVFPAHPGKEDWFSFENCKYCEYDRICPGRPRPSLGAAAARRRARQLPRAEQTDRSRRGRR